MQIDQAISDLQNWDTFGLAGRLQKPVLPFIELNSEFEQALEQNRVNAAHTALLMLFSKVEPVTLKEFLAIIVAFSYKGDIRMRMKMENPHKIANLVEGNL